MVGQSPRDRINAVRVTRPTPLSEYRQPDGHCRAFTDFALHLDIAAVQIDAAFYNHETETGAWPVIDVMPPMKGIEEPLAVGFWNSNALVADGAGNFCADS